MNCSACFLFIGQSSTDSVDSKSERPTADYMTGTVKPPTEEQVRLQDSQLLFEALLIKALLFKTLQFKALN